MENDSKLPALSAQQQGISSNKNNSKNKNNDDDVLDDDVLLEEEEEEDPRFPDSNSDVDLLQIVVKRTSASSESSCLEFSIEETATVMDLKLLIQDELADDDCVHRIVPVERQRLIFAGKLLTRNDWKLSQDVRMKKNTVNWIHLAPIPKGRTPTIRSQFENKLVRGGGMAATTMTSTNGPRRRRGGGAMPSSSSRQARSFRPYSFSPRQGDARNSPCQASYNFPNQFHSNNLFLSNTGAPHQMRPQQTLVDGLSLAMMYPQPEFSSFLSHNSHTGPFFEDPSYSSRFLEDTNVVVPLCHLLPQQLHRVLRGPDENQPELYHTTIEETVVLLNQLSQRSASLARNLRSISTQPRQRQHPTTSGATNAAASWGPFL